MLGSTTEENAKLIQEGDPLSEDELRGVVKTLTEREEVLMEGIDLLKVREDQVRHDATIHGLIIEVNELKKMVHESNENNNKLINLYQTMRNEFEQHKATYAASLHIALGGGSSTPGER